MDGPGAPARTRRGRPPRHSGWRNVMRCPRRRGPPPPLPASARPGPRPTTSNASTRLKPPVPVGRGDQHRFRSRPREPGDPPQQRVSEPRPGRHQAGPDAGRVPPRRRPASTARAARDRDAGRAAGRGGGRPRGHAPVAGALRALGLDPAALEPAEEAGVAGRRRARFEFRHPLLRSAIYHGASGPQRTSRARGTRATSPRARRVPGISRYATLARTRRWPTHSKGRGSRARQRGAAAAAAAA